ncbi:MAG TPA: hypothetical protein VFQ53_17430 [Kofleriaceae bacterium]|nr:hypothetical protein [Kofleriaceae bacterium]
MRTWIAISLVAALAAPAVADTARADRPRPMQANQVEVGCDFIEIVATSGKDASVDGELKPLEKRLKRLKNWNQFKQASKTTKTLATKKPEKLKLKNFTATATLVEVVNKSQVRLNLELEDGKGKVVANQTQLVSAADWVITAYVQTNGDGYLLAASCK